MIRQENQAAITRGAACLVLVAAAFAAHGEPPEACGIHLFILSGQSNMVGLDPDCSFTPVVTAAFPDQDVRVVKDAHGGQPIRRWYRDWKPVTGNRPKADGALYEQLLAKVHQALQSQRPDTVTFVWMQGERDAREDHGDMYAASLRGLISQLQEDLGREELFVVIGRLSDHGNEDPERPLWNAVRSAQVEVANDHPHWTWVNTDDLNGPDNNLHYTRDGFSILGRRFAENATRLIREKTLAGESPIADSAESGS